MQEFDHTTLAFLASESDFCRANILHPACELRWAGRFYEEFCAHERALGILWLLLEADRDACCTEFVASGRATRHYLARCSRDMYSDHYQAASRLDGFFDALAARDLTLAREIASLSPTQWMPDAEYEDDFCFAHFLQTFVKTTGSLPEQHAILARFESVLGGADTARLDLCQALLERNQKTFEEAFDLRLLEHRKSVAKCRATIAQEDVGAAIETYVFVEGLSVLVLAEQLGLSTKREYPFCPAIARAPGRARIGEQIFALP